MSVGEIVIFEADGLLTGAQVVGCVTHVDGRVVASDAMNDQQVTIAGTLRHDATAQRNHLNKSLLKLQDFTMTIKSRFNGSLYLFF